MRFALSNRAWLEHAEFTYTTGDFVELVFRSPR
jgi:hypothetical protein